MAPKMGRSWREDGGWRGLTGEAVYRAHPTRCRKSATSPCSWEMVHSQE